MASASGEALRRQGAGGARRAAGRDPQPGRSRPPSAGRGTVARSEDLTEPRRLAVEISPYGSAEVFVDDALAAAIPSPRLAVIGNGVVLPLALGVGRHRLAVRTCPSG